MSAIDKFKLWFFRLPFEQRRSLFSIFGMPVDEITTHGHETHCFKHVLSTLKPEGEQISALDGPYGYLIKHPDLNEEHWRLESEPLNEKDKADGFVAVPLYASGQISGAWISEKDAAMLVANANAAEATLPRAREQISGEPFGWVVRVAGGYNFYTDAGVANAKAHFSKSAVTAVYTSPSEQISGRLAQSLERVLLEIDLLVEAKHIPDVRNDIIFDEARSSLALFNGERS